jgi:hypothetical protein
MRRACCSRAGAPRWLGGLLLACCLLPAAAADEACSCLWEGSFSDVQHKADLVVSGSVVAGKGNSIDLSVGRILRGREYAGTIRVWLKARDYCRPEVEAFPAGSQWVMALYRIEEDVAGGFDPGTPNISYGRIGDYRLSSCGGYWLNQAGEWVTGNLAGAPRWVREPKMTPVLLDLVADFVAGKVPAAALAEAAQEDPALRELRLDTRAFLRQAE